MYLGHAAVEDFRGVTRRLAPRGITVRVVRDLGKDGIGDWDWDWDLVCGQLRTVSAVALRGGGRRFPMLGIPVLPKQRKQAGYLASSGTKDDRFKVW